MVLRLTCNFKYFLYPFNYGMAWFYSAIVDFLMSQSNKEARTMLGPELFLGQMICGFVSKGEKQDHSEQQGFNHFFDACSLKNNYQYLK